MAGALDLSVALVGVAERDIAGETGRLHARQTCGLAQQGSVKLTALGFAVALLAEVEGDGKHMAGLKAWSNGLHAP